MMSNGLEIQVVFSVVVDCVVELDVVVNSLVSVLVVGSINFAIGRVAPSKSKNA